MLAKLDGAVLNGTPLDFQVPERFRYDVDQTARRSSTGKYNSQGPPHSGQVSSDPRRPSSGRQNSIRKYRTNSTTHSDGNGRRNSIFTPQDARSDLPELLEIQEDPVVPGVPTIPEMPGVLEAPVVSEISMIPTSSEMPEAPQVSKAVQIPEVPQISEASHLLRLPQVSEVPQGPEIPSITERSSPTKASTHIESLSRNPEVPKIPDGPKVATPKKKNKKKKASQAPTKGCSTSVQEEESSATHSASR